MAIKDIFTMIKADRYTQDGREELIKAQEAVTEDVTYKPGDISRKTGLQKQPDGSWAPVKNAPGNKKPDGKSGSSEKHSKAMAHAEKVGVVSEVPTGWKKAEGVTTTPNGYVAITNGASLFPKEGEAKREIKFIKQEDFDKSASGSAPSESAPAEIKFEDAQKAINNGQVVQWKDSDGVWHDVDPKTSELVMARDIGTKLRVKTDENGNPVKAKPDPSMDETRSKLLELEKRRKKFEKYPDMDNSIKMQQAALLSKAGFGSRAEFEDFVKTMPTDSAPRILTGDCKIRIKKA